MMLTVVGTELKATEVTVTVGVFALSASAFLAALNAVRRNTRSPMIAIAIAPNSHSARRLTSQAAIGFDCEGGGNGIAYFPVVDQRASPNQEQTSRMSPSSHGRTSQIHMSTRKVACA